MLKFRIDRRIIFQGIFQETSMDLVGSPVFPDVPGRCRLKVVSNGDNDRWGGGGGRTYTRVRENPDIWRSPRVASARNFARARLSFRPPYDRCRQN